MTDLFQRFAWWMSHEQSASGIVQGYASLIQAFCAAITLVATVVLAFITRRYVRLTKKMLEVSEAQLQIGFCPTLDVGFSPQYKDNMVVQVELANTGNVPVKIRSAAGTAKILIPNPDTPGTYKGQIDSEPSTISTWQSLVLRVGEKAQGEYRLQPVSPLEGVAFNPYAVSQELNMELTDLTDRVTFSVRFVRDPISGHLKAQYWSPKRPDSE